MREITSTRFRPGFLVAAAGLFILGGIGAQSELSRKYLQTLKSIYLEVMDMGIRSNETFMQREFFIGAPDEDDTNKDISVLVFIQTVNGMDKMMIQVTYMERTRENPKVKLAKETRLIKINVENGVLRLEHCDYDERDLPRLAKDILKAVQDKKRLLRIKGE